MTEEEQLSGGEEEWRKGDAERRKEGEEELLHCEVMDIHNGSGIGYIL